jgi:hypothetical protein
MVRQQAKARRSFMLITSEVSEPRGHSPGLGAQGEPYGGVASAAGEPRFAAGSLDSRAFRYGHGHQTIL